MGAAMFLAFNIDEIAPELDAPKPDRLLAGDPKFKVWNFETSKDETLFAGIWEETSDGLYAGIWESTPGKWRVEYDEWEFCHILSGISILTEEGKSPQRLEAGNSFVIRPGFKGTWEVLETTRKEYVIRL